MSKDAVPALYTVEEAARVLRIGRTKAYAMTQEWRATGGQSGLPVVAFGNVLRVPRAALERLLGVDLGEAPAPAVAAPAAEPAAGPATEAGAAPLRPTHRPRPGALTPVEGDQLDLFDAAG